MILRLIRPTHLRAPSSPPPLAGIKWFPLGRDNIGPNVYMLKGVPNNPTPQNLPAVPIDIGFANW